MMIHGGAWSIGGSGHLPPDQITYLLEQGFAVVSPEYRLAPHVKLAECVEDLLDAYRFVQNGLNQVLKTELDVKRTCVMGWSAGGTGTLLLVSRLAFPCRLLPASSAGPHCTYISYICCQTDAIIRNGLERPRAILPTYPKTDNQQGWSEPMQAFTDALTDEEKVALDKLLAEPVCTNYPIK